MGGRPDGTGHGPRLLADPAPTVLSYADAGIDAASWNYRAEGQRSSPAAVIRIVTPVGITVLGLLIAGLGGWLVAAPFVDAASP